MNPQPTDLLLAEPRPQRQERRWTRWQKSRLSCKTESKTTAIIFPPSTEHFYLLVETYGMLFNISISHKPMETIKCTNIDHQRNIQPSLKSMRVLNLSSRLLHIMSELCMWGLCLYLPLLSEALISAPQSSKVLHTSAWEFLADSSKGVSPSFGIHRHNTH